MKKTFLRFGAIATMAAIACFGFTACGDKGGGEGGGGDVKVTAINVTSAGSSVAVGSTLTLSVEVLPSNATNKNVTWSSSSDATATVSGGTVTGVAAGPVTITATAADGSGKIGTISLTVTDNDGPSSVPTVIDGQFGDWAANEEADAVIIFEVGPNAVFDDLKVVKLNHTEDFLNFYYEFDKACLNKGGAGGTPIHVFLDIHGEDSTIGYNNPTNANKYWNFVLEKSLTNWDENDPTLISYNPDVIKFNDDAGNVWQNSSTIGNGFTTGAGVVEGDLIKYEFQITREMLPMELPSTIYVMFDCQLDWNASGLLPMYGDGSGFEGDLTVPYGEAYAWNIGD